MWLLATLICTGPIMGITFQLARITELPIVLLFAPSVLLGRFLPVSSSLLGAYILMPVQCIICGVLLAWSELTGRRRTTLWWLAAVHGVLAALALVVTQGRV